MDITTRLYLQGDPFYPNQGNGGQIEEKPHEYPKDAFEEETEEDLEEDPEGDEDEEGIDYDSEEEPEVNNLPLTLHSDDHSRDRPNGMKP